MGGIGGYNDGKVMKGCGGVYNAVQNKGEADNEVERPWWRC